MLCAVLSDIHGNHDALRAVLDDIEQTNADETICLGDIVGYGAEPVECVREIRRRNIATIAGNHDFAATGRMLVENFNEEARRSVQWTRAMLGAEDAVYLENLPLLLDRDGFVGFHATLFDPEAFDYILSPYDAASSFVVLEQRAGFFGHSHLPGAFIERKDEVTAYNAQRIRLREGSRGLFNVGSVGQPRDNDPRAAYMLYDTDTHCAELRRVRYDVGASVAKILAAGLPEVNAYRLVIGR